MIAGTPLAVPDNAIDVLVAPALVALCARLIAPVRAPAVLGLKVTLMLQLLPTATLAFAQVLLVMVKSAVLAAVNAAVVMANAAVPELDTVMVEAALVLPTFVAEKATDVGDTETVGVPFAAAGLAIYAAMSVNPARLNDAFPMYIPIPPVLALIAAWILAALFAPFRIFLTPAEGLVVWQAALPQLSPLTVMLYKVLPLASPAAKAVLLKANKPAKLA